MVDELAHSGIGPRAKANREGEGLPRFSRGALYCILANPLYRGLIRHKGQFHPGQHDEIVDKKTWDAVQKKLQVHAVRDSPTRRTASSPLLGKTFDESGRALTPTHAIKSGRRYRYYISLPTDGEKRSAWRLPANEIEGRVEDVAAEALSDKAAIVSAALAEGAPEKQIEVLLDHPQTRDILSRIESAQLTANSLRVRVRLDCVHPVTIERTVEIQMRRRGVERRLIIPGAAVKASTPPDPALVQAVARGMRWWQMLVSGQVATVKEIAKAAGVTDRYVSRMLPLAFLAPDIVEAVVKGGQPVGLTAESLTRKQLPIRWADQRTSLGFS